MQHEHTVKKTVKKQRFSNSKALLFKNTVEYCECKPFLEKKLLIANCCLIQRYRTVFFKSSHVSEAVSNAHNSSEEKPAGLIWARSSNLASSFHLVYVNIAERRIKSFRTQQFWGLSRVDYELNGWSWTGRDKRHSRTGFSLLAWGKCNFIIFNVTLY